jgi:hypothetical protein
MPSAAHLDDAEIVTQLLTQTDGQVPPVHVQIGALGFVKLLKIRRHLAKVQPRRPGQGTS